MSFIEMSLAGAAMILVIALIRALAINRVPKRTFPVLWGAALMRLLIPFYLPSGLSVYSVLARSAPPAAAHVMRASAAAIPAASLQAASAPLGFLPKMTCGIIRVSLSPRYTMITAISTWTTRPQTAFI